MIIVIISSSSCSCSSSIVIDSCISIKRQAEREIGPAGDGRGRRGVLHITYCIKYAYTYTHIHIYTYTDIHLQYTHTHIIHIHARAYTYNTHIPSGSGAPKARRGPNCSVRVGSLLGWLETRLAQNTLPYIKIASTTLNIA